MIDPRAWLTGIRLLVLSASKGCVPVYTNHSNKEVIVAASVTVDLSRVSEANARVWFTFSGVPITRSPFPIHQIPGILVSGIYDNKIEIAVPPSSTLYVVYSFGVANGGSISYSVRTAGK